MCLCDPSLRTPFCKNCSRVFKELKVELEQVKADRDYYRIMYEQSKASNFITVEQPNEVKCDVDPVYSIF